MDVGAVSEQGVDRENNEDRIVAEGKVFAVFDGMGGVKAGEVASGIGQEMLVQRAAEFQRTDLTVRETVGVAYPLLIDIHREIREASQKNPDLKGMGTTVVMAVPVKEKGQIIVVIAHVGDSRAQYLTEDGSIKPLTLDDSYVRVFYPDPQEALNKQIKLSSQAGRGSLDERETQLREMRNLIIQHLGQEEEIEPHISTVALTRGEKLLLTSDGVHDYLTYEEISKIVESSQTAEEAAAQLVDRAREKGSKDDRSVIVIKVENML